MSGAFLAVRCQVSKHKFACFYNVYSYSVAPAPAWGFRRISDTHSLSCRL